jgi:Zn-dependent protease
VAYRWGDTTAKSQGRLTLNPLSHIDPIGTLLFPIINMVSGMSLLIGWAKPVPINPNRFKKYRAGLVWVSLAGPGMNFILAIVSAALGCAIELWVPEDFYLFEPLVKMAYVSIQMNFMLGIFNLIPLPPLDGSKVIEAFLPYEAARKYESIAQYSYLILILLMFSGAFSYLGYPIYLLYRNTLVIMRSIFGLTTGGI